MHCLLSNLSYYTINSLGRRRFPACHSYHVDRSAGCLSTPYNRYIYDWRLRKKYLGCQTKRAASLFQFAVSVQRPFVFTPSVATFYSYVFVQRTKYVAKIYEGHSIVNVFFYILKLWKIFIKNNKLILICFLIYFI